MKRRDLKIIYDKISDTEKKAWATAANYASYQGLYGYLRNKPESIAYEEIVDALLVVVGQIRVNKFVSELKAAEIAKTDIEEYKKIILKGILNMQDIAKLINLRHDIVSACNSQITRLEIGNNLEIEETQSHCKE